MTDHIIHSNNWDIPDDLRQKFDEKTLRKFLQTFNKLSGGSYFFFDSFHGKIIVSSSESRILCGHSKTIAEREGYVFFRRILKPKELIWVRRLWLATSQFFFNLDEDKREDLMLLFDLIVWTKTNKKRLLHFSVVPHQLCNNGNPWLMLVCVSSSVSQKQENAATIVNMNLQTRHDLIKGEFKEIRVSPLTPVENEMLLLFAQNMLESEICKALKINRNKYYRMRDVLFDKLEVDTPAGAILRALQLGFI